MAEHIRIVADSGFALYFGHCSRREIVAVVELPAKPGFRRGGPPSVAVPTRLHRRRARPSIARR
jgi:hypothetical protein